MLVDKVAFVQPYLAGHEGTGTATVWASKRSGYGVSDMLYIAALNVVAFPFPLQ
jgi:hypothetical protein